MGRWPPISLEDLAAPGPHSLATGPFGSAVASRYFRSQGVPLIRGSNLSMDVGTRILDDDMVFLDEDKAAEFARSVARRGDLVFTCWGSIGQVGLIDSRSRYDRYIVSNKQMKLTPDQALADSLFLYYALSSPSAVAGVQSIAIGSSVPGFNLGQLKQIQVPLPPLPVQRAIAELLGALDDKIDANLYLIKALESLLRARFDQLIQEFQEGANEDPELGSVVGVVRQQVQPGTLDPSTSYVGLEHLPRGSVFIRSVGVAGDVASAKSLFGRQDILFGKLRPYFRKVAIADGEGVCSTDILVLRPLRSGDLAYCLMLASSQEFIDHCDRASAGTRMPRVSWADMAPYPASGYVASVKSDYQGFAMPLIERAEAALAESRILAELRDLLLPSLLSGELQVRNAESLVGEAL